MPITARLDWEKHSLEDFAQFSDENKNFVWFLLEQFAGSDYSIIWADDYSREEIFGEENDNRPGNKRFIGWYEVGGIYLGRKNRVAYLRLHQDGHVELSRATQAFLEKFKQPLENYTRDKLYVAR